MKASEPNPKRIFEQKTIQPFHRMHVLSKCKLPVTITPEESDKSRVA